MNCGALVYKWTDEDKDLIFEMLSTSDSPVHRRIGRNEELNMLMFIDIETIKHLLKRVKSRTRTYHVKSYMSATEEEFRRARKLLKQVNKYMQG